MSENVPPIASGVGGSLLEAGARTGRQTLTFDAADADSGIRSTTVLVDGVPVAVDDTSASCRYDDFSPCPTTLPDRFVVVDTTGLAAGRHRLVLRIEDAAHNVAFKDVGNFLIGGRNAPRVPPTATLKARYAVSLRQARRLGWNQRFRTRGRLTALSGRPLVGARIVATVGRPARTIGRATTGPDGAWGMTLRARFASGPITFTYADGHGSGASTRLIANVRAGVRLRAARRVVGAFGRIVLTGRLLGGPMPRRGKVIELRARGRGEHRWITFESVRTDRRGRFSAHHRLRQGYRGIVYEFQAVSRYEAAYRYEPGASNIVRVKVR